MHPVTVVISTNARCRWRKATYQFWTISGTSSLHFLLFGFAHVWLLNKISLSPEGRFRLANCYRACFFVAFSSLISLMVGWQVLRAQDLLPKVGWKEKPQPAQLNNGKYRSCYSALPRSFQYVLLALSLLKLARWVVRECRKELRRSRWVADILTRMEDRLHLHQQSS